MEALEKIKADRLAKQEQKNKSKDLAHTAHDCYYDDVSKKFIKVTLKYNPETKEAKVDSVEELTDVKYRAFFEMEKIMRAKLDKGLK